MCLRCGVVALAALWLGVGALAAEPPPEPDRPGDEELDKPAETFVPAPTPLPEAKEKAGEPGKKAEEPKGHNPFGRKRTRKPAYAVPCRLTYSDGTVVEGYAWRPANAIIRIFNRARRAHEDYFLSDLKRITVRPESEHFERDWRWKNQGSSEKVFLETGYLWNQYVTTFVTTDGERATGDCSGQFYLLPLDGERTKWYLFKRHSGRDRPHKKRDELEPLVYVKSVEFTDDILKKKPEAPAPAADKKDGDPPAKKPAPKAPETPATTP